VTQGSGSGLEGVFTINYPPVTPTILLPANDTWSRLENTTLTYIATDPDSDSITYYAYGLENINASVLINYSSISNFTWLNLNDTNYYFKVMASDEHGYNSSNSTVRMFKADNTEPVLNNISISSIIYTDESVTIEISCHDARSGMNNANFNITTSVGTITLEALSNVADNTYRDVYLPLGIAGTYTIGTFWCFDVAGNVNNNMSLETFTTLLRTGSGDAGGGAAQAFVPPLLATVEPAFVPECGDGICSPGESGECLADCPVNLDRIVRCIWDPEISCIYEDSWFVTLVIIISFLGALYFQVKTKTIKKRRIYKIRR